MRKQSGFTMVELMVTIAILGILGAVALPSYQSYMADARRGEAISVAYAVAQAQEKRLLEEGAYTATLSNLGYASSTTASGNYTIAVSLLTTNSSYKVELTAVEGSLQASDSESGTSCATLTLKGTGAKTPAACWN